MTMCVSALALTSLDAVYWPHELPQELFSVDDMEHAEGWRKLFCNVLSTFITLVFGFILTRSATPTSGRCSVLPTSC